MQFGASPVSGTTGSGDASVSSSSSDSTCWTFEVTERDIHRFLQAIGEPVQVSVLGSNGPDAGALPVTAPPLFYQVMAWQDVGPQDLPPDGAPLETQGGPRHARSMGGASEFTVYRLARAGERFVVRSTLTGVQTRQGRQGTLHLVTRETTFTDALGVEAAREVATYLRRVA